jgi:protein SCO1/2
MNASASVTQTRLLLIGIGLAAAVLLAVALWWKPAAPPPVELSPRGGDFRLQSADGPVGLADFRGKLVLVYFGYTRCPDICPTSLAYLTQALGSLPPAAKAAVQVLFVSVDPERDNLEHLRTYAHYFDPAYIGLTDTPERIKAVAEQYGVGYRKVEGDSALGYSVDHSADIYLIDPAGTLQTRIAHGTPPGEILRLMQPWLPSPSKP